MNYDSQIMYWAHMLDECDADKTRSVGDGILSENQKNELKSEMLAMIKEARMVQRKKGMCILKEHMADTEKIDKKIVDTAEKISQSQTKLNDFVNKNQVKVEDAIKKIDAPNEKKWYICAWNMIKAAVKAGGKFIAKNWFLLAKILIALWIGWMLWSMPERICTWIMQAWEMYKKAWSEFLNSPTTDKIMQAWAGPESTPATRAVYKMNNTNGFGAFFDPGFSF